VVRKRFFAADLRKPKPLTTKDTKEHKADLVIWWSLVMGKEQNLFAADERGPKPLTTEDTKEHKGRARQSP